MAESDGTEGGTLWLSVPEAARYLGISERAVRKRIGANTIPAEREGGGPWRVQVSAADAVPSGTKGGTTNGTGSTPGGTKGGTVAEPIEAAYRVAGEAAAEVALVPLATMVEEVRGLAAELQEMSRRNEALALEVGQLRERQVGHAGEVAAKEETIAALRRQVELAEAERDRPVAAQAAPAASHAAETREEARRGTAEALVAGTTDARSLTILTAFSGAPWYAAMHARSSGLRVGEGTCWTTRRPGMRRAWPPWRTSCARRSPTCA